MKKIFLAAMVFVFAAGAADAQTKTNKERSKGAHHMRKGGGHHQLLEKLNLTEAQKGQLKSIKENQRQELATLKKNDQITVANWKAQRKAIHEKYKTQFQSVLTQQQKDQLKQAKAERSNRSFAAFSHMNGERLRKMAAELHITDAQKQQLTAIGQEFRTKAQSIRSNTSLTDQAKKEQMNTLRTQHMNQAKSVLTKEQVEKL